MRKMKILPIFIWIWVWDLRVFSGVLSQVCDGFITRHTRDAGTGFAGVWIHLPVPQPQLNPSFYPGVWSTRGNPYSQTSVRSGFLPNAAS